MATSAQLPRLSFGAGNNLDLSLNLPIVLVPPSSNPRTEPDSASDYGEDRQSMWRLSKGQQTQLSARKYSEDVARTPTPNTAHSRNDSRGSEGFLDDGSEYEDDDFDDDVDYGDVQIATVASVPVPKIPERDVRRVNKQQPPISPNSNIPLHPITSMQKAFAESLLEVTGGKPADKPNIRFGDAKARREELISQEREDELYSARWRYRPGQHQHELRKLMAQISFGVYLLLNGMANSATQVVNILQGHIDEVDEFLEVAMEDFKQASNDLKERIDYLRLPMENMEVFEKLLEDRNFRLQIVEGNEKIEHIIARTNVQLEQYEKDVEQGLASAKEFAGYLNQQQNGAWRQDRPDIVDIYEAMKGNTEGWFNAFADLQAQGQDLNDLVARLNEIVAEMSNKAGEISRKTWADIPPFSSPAHQPSSSKGTGHFMTPPSSMSSPKSADRSRVRASSFGGSIPTSSRLSSKSSPNAIDYFDFPIKEPDSNSGDDHQSPAIADNSPTVAPIHQPAGDNDSDVETTKEPDDGGILLLQPRTYTPQPPEPLPSPMIREESKPAEASPQREKPTLTKQTSLRQRVSMKTQPPESIHIPPPPPSEYRPSSPSTWRVATPDSTRGSDYVDRHHYGLDDMSAPAIPSVMASSPRSDHQYYRPVQASPHSPLRQRPQTAGAAPIPRYPMPSDYRPGHERNVPSRMGGASMLSNVTTMTADTQTTATNDKKLKKKRSALGWLKKAFSLDEEERMAYEARKHQQSQNLYYDARSPKYLDGRRVR